MKPALTLLFSCLFSCFLSAQVAWSVTVQNGSSTTTCDDIFSGPDPLWQVRIEGGDWLTYDNGDACFQDFPFTQYRDTVTCAADLPAQIELCFRAFENDALLPCAVFRSCSEEVCQTFSVPTAAGMEADYNLTLAGGSSAGSVDFTVAVEAPLVPDFNDICGAVDLGTLTFGNILGSASAGGYNSRCADNIDEINPIDNFDYLLNDAAVWFKFRTGSDISGLTRVVALNDPLGLGDTINLEMLVYTAAGDLCTGTLTRHGLFTLNLGTLDASINLICLDPDQDYYILVDGSGIPDNRRGDFGLEVIDDGYAEGGDLRCDAVDLGLVPENGSVTTPTPLGNFCAGFSDDPVTPGFISRNSIWYSFIMPASGHVRVDAVTDSIDLIDIEIAFYQSSNNLCSGFFTPLLGQRDPTDFNETFTRTCLDPGRRYWVLVDGSGAADRGFVTLTVTDLGDIRPVTTIDTTICAGNSVTVGTSIIHDSTGTYIDTLKYLGNCDSIVITNLTVLAPLELAIEQTRPALGMNGTDGRAVATYSGGLAPYTLTWCNGTTDDVNENLAAGTECCVTLTDSIGCMRDTCFTVDFVIPIVPLFSDVTLLCNGDTDGRLDIQVTEGRPPYDFSWTEIGGTLSGTGTLVLDGDFLVLTDLPAGSYEINLNDGFFDTTFVAQVFEPDLLEISEQEVRDASCFGFCDGEIGVDAFGGTPEASGNYSYLWSDGVTTLNRSGLCAGTYGLTVTDANGCSATYQTAIDQPAELIALALPDRQVSCFGGADGSATVTLNGNPIGYAWSNGDNNATATGLSAGDYEVTVTNFNGCQAVTGIRITQPSEPLTVAVNNDQPIRCFNTSDGILSATGGGPFDTLLYTWSNGAVTPQIDSLGAGDYSVTLTNELGCTAEAATSLQSPLPILAELEIRDLNCLDRGNPNGAITIAGTSGGRGDYRYAIGDGQPADQLSFGGLEAGSYELTIIDGAGCELFLDAVVNPPPVLTAVLGEDRELLLGDSTQLFLQVSSTDVRITWSHDPLETRIDPYVAPLASTTYRAVVFDTLTFCETTAAVRITLDSRPRVYVPTGFSPNGDGTNDIFRIFAGTDVRSVDYLRIFDRRGGMVHENTAPAGPNDPVMNWDGLMRDRPAAAGVYVWVAQITFVDGRTEILKGSVTLVR